MNRIFLGFKYWTLMWSFSRKSQGTFLRLVLFRWKKISLWELNENGNERKKRRENWKIDPLTWYCWFLLVARGLYRHRWNVVVAAAVAVGSDVGDGGGGFRNYWKGGQDAVLRVKFINGAGRRKGSRRKQGSKAKNYCENFHNWLYMV